MIALNHVKDNVLAVKDAKVAQPHVRHHASEAALMAAGIRAEKDVAADALMLALVAIQDVSDVQPLAVVNALPSVQ